MEGTRPDKFAFGVRIGRVVDGGRPAKGCVRKWLYGFANGQQELSAAEEINVKNMETFYEQTAFLPLQHGQDRKSVV